MGVEVACGEYQRQGMNDAGDEFAQHLLSSFQIFYFLFVIFFLPPCVY
jgi:hypothetical protein